MSRRKTPKGSKRGLPAGAVVNVDLSAPADEIFKAANRAVVDAAARARETWRAERDRLELIAYDVAPLDQPVDAPVADSFFARICIKEWPIRPAHSDPFLVCLPDGRVLIERAKTKAELVLMDKFRRCFALLVRALEATGDDPRAMGDSEELRARAAKSADKLVRRSYQLRLAQLKRNPLTPVGDPRPFLRALWRQLDATKLATEAYAKIQGDASVLPHQGGDEGGLNEASPPLTKLLELIKARRKDRVFESKEAFHGFLVGGNKLPKLPAPWNAMPEIMAAPDGTGIIIAIPKRSWPPFTWKTVDASARSLRLLVDRGPRHERPRRRA